MIRKKNKFWTFIFSLMPGAGEMYMGFMKMGVSLMISFFLIFSLASFLELDAFIFLAFIVWFYGFFHAQNLAGMPDEEFYALEDDYLFHLTEGEAQGKAFVRAYRKIIAAVLILVGVVMTWKSVFSMLEAYIPSPYYDMVENIGYCLPQIVVGVAIVLLGIYMIRGKKVQLDTWEKQAASINEETAVKGEGKSDALTADRRECR